MKRFLPTTPAVLRGFGLLAASLLSPLASCLAQDIHFSQFYENAGLRNPALTGIFSGDYKAGVNYRTQWGNAFAAYQTVLASGEYRHITNPETGDCVSFGLTATYDRAGSINMSSMQVMPAINYNKAIDDRHASYLSAGFAAGFHQRSVDASKMTFDNQYIGGAYVQGANTGETMGFDNIQHFDVSTGVSWNSSIGAENRINYYLGAAGFHLNRPKAAFNGSETFIRLQPRYTGQLGIRWGATEKVGITTHFNYNQQGPYRETIGGGLVSYDAYTDPNRPMSTVTVYAGLFYRLKDAMIPTVKADWGVYSLTVSYDMTTSTLKPTTSGVGGWEMSLYVRGLVKREIDRTKCPRFEMLLPAFEQ